jgi:hypothetical protein
MAAPERFGWIIVGPVLPDLAWPDNPDSLLGAMFGLSSRHCERSEAIQSPRRGNSLDCFGSLAMTGEEKREDSNDV